MAITANTVWEFRTTGSDNNGGGFDSTIAGAGTDYSTQDASQLSVTDGATSGAGSTTLTSATGGFTAAMIGNTIYIRSGTNFQSGFYQITGQTNTNTVTLDRTPTSGGAGSAGTLEVGGARANVDTNSWPAALVAGNTVYIKNGTYTTANAFSPANGTATTKTQFIGYNTTRGDNPLGSSRPTINFGANAVSFGTTHSISFLIFTGTASAGVSLSNDTVSFCKFTSTSSTATDRAVSASGATNTFLGCEFTAANCIAFQSSSSEQFLHGCYIHDSVKGCDLTPTINVSLIATNCIFSKNTTHVVSNGNSGFILVNDTFYGGETPTGTGVNFGGGDYSNMFNNIFYGLATGVTTSSQRYRFLADYNCFNNNTTNRTNVNAGSNDSTANPTFANAAGQDWSIGTNLKALGFPGTFPAGTSSTGFIDIGAVQRKEPAGGGSSIIGGL